MGQLDVKIIAQGDAWLDMGTHESLLEAHQFVHAIEKRQGIKICCPEEIAFKKGWISEGSLKLLAQKMLNDEYGQYLIKVIEGVVSDGNSI